MRELQVVTFTPIDASGRSFEVSLVPPDPPREITGILKLVQIVVLAIYNNPGRNVFAPSQGSGLPSLIGTNISSDDPSDGIALVTERIEKIRDEILENQSALENENPEERLVDLTILAVESGVNIDEINVRLKIVNEAGQETTITI